jgi:hypothetical protein
MPHLATYVGLADHSERTLADSFRAIAEGHAQTVDVFHTCHTLAGFSDDHRRQLGPVVARYGEESAGHEVEEPERLHATGLARARAGEIGLLRDLQDLHVLATLVQTTWTVIAQGAQGLRDHQLLEVATAASRGTARQLAWLNTRMKAAAPQALIVSPPQQMPGAAARDSPEPRSGDDLVETLRRWEDFGAVWRVLQRDASQVTIGLFRCDAGEEVGRLVSGAPELMSFLERRGPDGPAA